MTNRWVFPLLVAASATLALTNCTSETTPEPPSSADEDGEGGSVEVPKSGSLSLSGHSVALGNADCGGQAPAEETLTLRNDGEGPLRWAVSLTSNAYFEIAGERGGTLEPGAEVEVAISAKSMPTTVKAGTIMQATMLLTTDDPLHPQLYVPVTATARGATFVLSTTVDFGKVPVGEDAPGIPLTVKNVGNAAAEIAIATPEDEQFSFSWAGGEEGVSVAAGEAVPELTAHFKPVGPAAASSSGAVVVKGAVCGDSIQSVVARGQGIAGIPGASPATVDFGNVACGTQANPRTVTLYNSGNDLMSWKATLAEGTVYTISQSEGVLGAGATLQIVVRSAGIPMTDNVAENGFGDVLTITTSLPGVEPLEVPIKQTAYGAILSLTAEEPLDFGDQDVGTSSDPEPVTITNDGSAEVEVQIVGVHVDSDPASGTVAAGGDTLEVNVSFAPQETGPLTGSIGVTTDGPLCQPLPVPLEVIGTGT